MFSGELDGFLQRYHWPTIDGVCLNRRTRLEDELNRLVDFSSRSALLCDWNPEAIEEPVLFRKIRLVNRDE